jgi:uncharacterized protein
LIAYADSSALVKLVLAEPESAHLLSHLQTYDTIVSSDLAAVEVPRAVRRAAVEAAAEQASAALDSVALLAIDSNVIKRASTLPPTVLRSLDAIHLASALELGESVVLVAYDRRLLTAALDLGLAVASPAPQRDE